MFIHALQLFKDTSVASIAPTSTYCIKQMLRKINFPDAKVIIEYGPGDGAITKHLLRKMRSDARLILVETNEHFVSLLTERYTDPRISIIHDSAENILQIRKKLDLDKADYIISGIPFSLISQRAKEDIIRDSALALRYGGRMIVYQSLTALGARKALREMFKEYFDTTKNKSYLFNLPPLYVFEAIVKKNAIFI